MTENDEKIVKKMGEGFLAFAKAVVSGDEAKAVSIMDQHMALVDGADDRQAVLEAHLAEKDQLVDKAAQTIPLN